jgi:hypothetical protein
MVSRSFAAVLLLPAILAGGLAIGAPTRGDYDWRDRSKPESQLDRAALFRPAQVAECGSVRREDTAARREQRRDRRAPRKASSYGCNATWSN